MGKTKRSGIGFSAAKPAATPKQQDTKGFAGHTAKEQQAVALINQGNLQEAEAIYRKLLRECADNATYQDNLATILGMQGKHEEAVPLLRKAVKSRPLSAEAHTRLGMSLQHSGDLSKATEHYNKAISINPSNCRANNNLGIILKGCGQLDTAITHYIAAINAKNDYHEAHNNLGIALLEKGEISAAYSAFKACLAIKSDYALAISHAAMIELLNGNYTEGWIGYEKRFRCPSAQNILIAQPKCATAERVHLESKQELLLISEQGLGDTLQFMRYATALRNQGLSVSVCAQPKLHTLIQTSGIDPSPLIPQQANEVSEGQWIPLLSVPRHLGVSPENPIITEPYIKTTDELIDKWKGILSPKQRPIVGINWQGNPTHEKTDSFGRSLLLETFAAIATNTNATLLSLQKGFGSEQLDTCSFKDSFVSCQDQVNETWDFLETAAIIANCDLVITSDTSVAHLAGGMGKNTWLLLKKVPEWRWGLEGDTTFWYPSMRLFRQKERGNWDEVMERVAEALQEHFGNGSVPTQPAAAPQPSSKPEPIQDIQAPISLGELIDKITILQIKTQHLQGNALENVKKELEALETTLRNLHLNIDTTLIQRLKEVNQDLWQIEDDIRDQERQKSFSETFIGLARSVYQQTDRRAAIKKEINTTYGSAFVEEKSYQQY